ncbi:chymotrypsinogen A-like [Oppia nitens]|uniref:chymotrypsinogen A-like n=1 Tax=Oppia nitens TaxID=1686743 RepID=UPI0023DBEA47|nr:chymotrypsinogen A-like [Oppia nitens]
MSMTGQHSDIVDYPNVTLDRCGIGRQSLLLTKDVGHCLKWYNRSSLMLSEVQYGRVAEPGEWPWITYIKIKLKYDSWLCFNDCYVTLSGTGVILNKQWIITAAHVLFMTQNEYKDYKLHSIVVYPGINDKRVLGKSYESDKHFANPLYKYSHNSRDDIGLIKLKEELPIHTHPTNNPLSTAPVVQQSDNQFMYTTQTMNSICLPKESQTNFRQEFALFAGFGHLNNSQPNEDRLRMGWTRISGQMSNTTDEYGKCIVAVRDPEYTGSASCKGDSGGPLIQFINGRAVLIGVLSSGSAPPEETCTERLTYFVRIAHQILWIVRTVSRN